MFTHFSVKLLSMLLGWWYRTHFPPFLFLFFFLFFGYRRSWRTGLMMNTECNKRIECCCWFFWAFWSLLFSRETERVTRDDEPWNQVFLQAQYRSILKFVAFDSSKHLCMLRPAHNIGILFWTSSRRVYR
jgi:hypothetical protein